MGPYNTYGNSEHLQNHGHAPYFEQHKEENPHLNHLNELNPVVEAHGHPYHSRILNGYDYNYPAESTAASNSFCNTNEQPNTNYATEFQNMSINHGDLHAHRASHCYRMLIDMPMSVTIQVKCLKDAKTIEMA